MNNKSRSLNSKRNLVVSIVLYAITTISSFISRTIFVKVLGVQYLGISGLFANILTMLSLSDLGIYTVMVYSLYTPLANNEIGHVKTLVRYFQKLYNIIAVVVLLIGLMLIPLLPYMVNNSELTNREIIVYYILLLLNTVSSYIAVSKTTLLRADQQMHLVQMVSSISILSLQFLQIAILLVFNKYAFYLIVQIVITIITNLILSFIAQKKYPYLKDGVTDTEYLFNIKRNIKINLRSTFLYKVGNVIINSTDNILISIIVGTAFVGYYSNYVTVYSIINSFIMVLIQAVLASIGNYYATKSNSQKEQLFKTLLLVFYFIASFCVACYIAGMNDFIQIWIGKQYVLDGYFIYALAAYRFTFCIMHPLWITRESVGLFYSTKYLMVCDALLNIVLSIILGGFFGVVGIIFATALSNILTVLWYEPVIIYKKIFNNSVNYYFKYIFRLIFAVTPTIVVAVILKQFSVSNVLLLFCKFLLCAIMAMVSFLVVMGKSHEAKWLLNLILKKENK